jgi:hypothetical protein
MSELLLQQPLQSGALILVKTGNSMPGPFVGIHDLVREMPMGLAHAAVCLAFGAGIAFAQIPPNGEAPTVSPHSTGRTTSPETKGQAQPQGRTGPIDTRTTTKGAPPGSPQGETPPGTEAAPQGSSKTVVDPRQ